MKNTSNTKRGRPKIHKTKGALEQAAKRHQEKANEKRNERYTRDPEFSAKEKARARRNYARTRGKLAPKSFGLRAGKAQHSSILVDIKGAPERVLGIREMAFVCNVAPKVLKGWIDANKFPAPRIVGPDRVRYYTVPQADALAAVLKNGLRGRGAFRATDTELIKQLHSTNK